MFQQPARKHDQVDVRRLRRAIRSGNAARAHRLKDTNTVFIGTQSAETAKCRITVGAVRIGLPYLDQRIRNRDAVAIEDATDESNALTWGAGLSDAGKVGAPGHAEMEKRADGL